MTSTSATSIVPFHLDRPGCSGQLDREWRRLRTSRSALATAQAWSVGDPNEPLTALVHHVCDLDEIVQATQRGRAHGDEILLRLLDLGATEPLAHRIVLQRLIAPVIGRARAYLRSDPDAIETALACAWLAIRSYDTRARRRSVAASLLSDTIDRSFRGPARRRSRHEVPATDVLFERRSTEERPDAFCELARSVAEARRHGVGAEHLDLIRALVGVDSPAALAARAGVTDRTIRNRRSRAIDAIRLAVAPAA